MSEHIVHVAVYEDCLNLMGASAEISDDFKRVAAEFRDFGELGSTTVSGDQFSFKLLKEYRERWAERKPEDHLEYKLAFVFGWVSHRAADREMKPVWRLGPIKELAAKQGLKPTECSIYHEGFMFREYYLNDPIFGLAVDPKRLADESAEFKARSQRLVTLMRSLVKRNLIETHTLKPDYDDVDGWFDRLRERQQTFHVSIDRYAEAALRPDPEKVRLYLTEVNFFDERDPVIVLCKKLRQSGTDAAAAGIGAEVAAAVRAPNASHYAKAVALGYSYLKAASDYYAGTIDFETLTDKLDIGKSGPQGIGV